MDVKEPKVPLLNGTNIDTQTHNYLAVKNEVVINKQIPKQT